MQTFATWLAEHRKAAGLTQEELAGRVRSLGVGCSKSYISTLERASARTQYGEPVRPSLEVVDALADVLDVGRASGRLSAGYAAPGQEVKSSSVLAEQIERILNKLPIDQQDLAKRKIMKMAELLVASAA